MFLLTDFPGSLVGPLRRHATKETKDESSSPGIQIPRLNAKALSHKTADVLMVAKNSKPSVLCHSQSHPFPKTNTHTHSRTRSYTHRKSSVGQGEGANICQDPWHRRCQQGHMHSKRLGASCHGAGSGCWSERVNSSQLR